MRWAQFQGLEYREERVACRLAEFQGKSGALTRAILRALDTAQVDCAITVDTGYWPLFVAWYRHIPGCHCFFALNNVMAFARVRAAGHFLRGRTVFANSRFMQQRVQELLQLEAELWYSSIDLQAYRAPPGARGTQIGFYAEGPTKGDEIVLALARQMPERTFLVAGSRFVGARELLPNNVAYLGHVSEMGEFYSQIRLLLVPSLVEDAFPRVILEAAANGIPVIANDVGGIPEALGDAGVRIPYDPRQQPDIAGLATRYAAEIQHLFDDPFLYHLHSQKALARARRFEREQKRQLDHIYDTYFCSPGHPART
ncbi:MAG: glycosyltransferase [Chloroflexi bacterium]|nr:glycosyltransferase [Chloroflexota bacterium]